MREYCETGILNCVALNVSSGLRAATNTDVNESRNRKSALFISLGMGAGGMKNPFLWRGCGRGRPISTLCDNYNVSGVRAASILHICKTLMRF